MTTLTKKTYLHANGVHEEYFVDSEGRKQGLYVAYSRKTKKKVYECYFMDGKKVGIENVYNGDGTLKVSLCISDQLFSEYY